MGPSIYQCNLGGYRKWKIRLCREIRTQYQTHDDPNTGSHHVVLWRIPDFIRNRRWGGISTRIAGLGHPRPQRKTFNHPRRSHGRNGSKSSFSVYEEESPQCHVHRSESLSSRKTPLNHKSQCPLHGRLQKPERRIADHGLGASNVSPKDEILFGSLHCSYCSTPRLFSHRYETRDTRHLATEEQYLSQ